MKYKHAFECMKTGECPERGGKKGCPAWGEWPETERQTLKQVTMKGCTLPQSPRFTAQLMFRLDQLVGRLQQYEHALEANLAAPRALNASDILQMGMEEHKRLSDG